MMLMINSDMAFKWILRQRESNCPEIKWKKRCFTEMNSYRSGVSFVLHHSSLKEILILTLKFFFTNFFP